MSSSGNPAASASPGAFTPFGHRAFALLWTATLISNIGTWMHDVGAGWLMTTLDPSPGIVSLVQAATTLPVFLFALLAGALADRLDKRRLLVGINCALALVVTLLATLVWAGQMTPQLLLGITLILGTGAAFMAPAWQAIVPMLVPRADLKPAIALNSMGINISRAIGPALAGVLIAGVGLAAPFALNAISHLVIIAALLAWTPPETARPRITGSLLADMRTGLRHVRHNDAMRAVLLRAASFFLCASAYWSLLPLIAREEGGGSTLYGGLMALIGTGAVCGALALPRLQRRLGTDRTARTGALGTVLALLVLAASDSPLALLPAAFLGGLAWIAVLTAFNLSAQTALPDWVRARGLAVFLMVFFGSMALGAVLWGQLAARLGIDAALLMAAGGLLVGLWLTRRVRIGTGERLDHTPASAWPEAPALADPARADRAAMVTVTYRVAPEDREAFLSTLHAFAPQRLRDGASQWHLHESVEEPGIWVETFMLPSWAEHLAQHERLSRSDADLQAELRAFDRSPEGPQVRHFLKD
ncbi:MFS transporter [Paracoccus sp. MBLB3053]|uniref:MFS transporter n=1 Tax=Paracoccus aurantius TaxID=3073814 RepID=A0ABU2HWE6_9RHOB|nr:MFS transporter [Paracoccus sp. MBLB3053]MDS9468875.1 MFS transporter [Paracoccus sp. MBLB3053]